MILREKRRQEVATLQQQQDNNKCPATTNSQQLSQGKEGVCEITFISRVIKVFTVRHLNVYSAGSP
jgi:hypothetical protein